MRATHFLPLLLSAGCFLFGGGKDNCSWEVISLTPADGADGVWVSDNFDALSVTLDVEITALRLLDEDGEEREGDVELDGTTATFRVTNGSLFGDHTYSIVVEADGCDATVGSFTTGDYLQFELPSDVTYGLDLSDAEGSGLAVFQTMVVDAGAEPGFHSPEFGEWVLVPMEDGDQDTCMPTTDLSAGWAGSEAAMYNITAPFGSLDGNAMWFDTTDIYALVSPDGAGWDRARIDGYLDVTPLVEGIGPDFCDVIVAFGDACEPCPADSDFTCVRLDLTGVTASVVGGAPRIVDDFCEPVE